MKRLWLIMSFAALVGVLSGCVVLFGPPPVFDATVWTDFHDGEAFYICDTRNTLMTYSFRFSSALVSWDSNLRGEETRDISHRRTLTFSSPGVNRVGDRVTYSFTINAETAPLSVDAQAVSPQAIFVEAGKARLVLEGRGSDDTSVTLESAPISIRSATGPTCPAN